VMTWTRSDAASASTRSLTPSSRHPSTASVPL
jgi:hypothetical protein